jgi:hypothetical protein
MLLEAFWKHQVETDGEIGATSSDAELAFFLQILIF